MEEESRTHYMAERPFNLFRSWGNLSPWYSVPRGAFGIDDTAEPPHGCVVTGLHLLHRHGARYPTAWGACPPFVKRLMTAFLTGNYSLCCESSPSGANVFMLRYFTSLARS